MTAPTAESKNATERSEGRGLLLVVSGPSGVGKTSIVRELEQRLGGRFSVSATTRDPGPGEVEGRDYYFLPTERFVEMRDRGEFLESAEVFGRHWYGTPRRPVEEALERGELIILDIDVQGALQVRDAMPDALMLFILPPSDEELLRRLRARGREPEDVIERRYAEARHEIELARTSDAYDHMLVNDQLDAAIDRACALVRRRRHA